MASIAVQILVQSHVKLLKRAIDSLRPLACPIIIAKFGDDDGAVMENIECSQLIRMARCEDRAKLRNQIAIQSGSKWNLYLEPWEVLTAIEPIMEVIENGEHDVYHLPVLQGDMITKEARLWRAGAKFKNPVYETIVPAGDAFLDCLIYSDGAQEDNAALIAKWRREAPGDSDAIYYAACHALSRKQYDEFLVLSSHFLFDKEFGSMSVIMTKYYRSIVNSLMKRNVDAAIKETLECLAIRPLMAEFWCLLGDIHYSLLRDYSKSQQYYENAILLGARRLNNDLWPMQLSKYQDYPQQMIESCRKIRQQSLWMRA